MPAGSSACSAPAASGAGASPGAASGAEAAAPWRARKAACDEHQVGEQAQHQHGRGEHVDDGAVVHGAQHERLDEHLAGHQEAHDADDHAEHRRRAGPVVLRQHAGGGRVGADGQHHAVDDVGHVPQHGVGGGGYEAQHHGDADGAYQQAFPRADLRDELRADQASHEREDGGQHGAEGIVGHRGAHAFYQKRRDGVEHRGGPDAGCQDDGAPDGGHGGPPALGCIHERTLLRNASKRQGTGRLAGIRAQHATTGANLLGTAPRRTGARRGFSARASRLGGEDGAVPPSASRAMSASDPILSAPAGHPVTHRGSGSSS